MRGYESLARRRSRDGKNVEAILVPILIPKIGTSKNSVIRTGTAMWLIYTCFYDSLWLFKHIFTDFENFRFVYTPLPPNFPHLFSLGRCENRQKIVKIAKIVKIVKNRFLSLVTYGPAIPWYGFSGYLSTFFRVFSPLLKPFCCS